MRNPAPLYTKLDLQVVDEEVQRIGDKVVQEAGVLTGLDQQTASIYAPIQSHLDQVEAKLADLCRNDNPELKPLSGPRSQLRWEAHTPRYHSAGLRVLSPPTQRIP